MPTQHVCATLVLCTIVLFSCNNKNEKSNPGNTGKAVVATLDTVQVKPGETFNLSDYNNSFTANITQKFTALPRKISVVTAKKGLKITIDSAILEKEDGSAVDGKIEVSIIELTTSDELFKSDAATISNGRLLASGGSYFIGMACNGQKLRIKKHKSMQVDFPVIKEEEMQLFYGQRNETGIMNWTSAGVNLQQRTDEEENTNNQIQFNKSQNAFDGLPVFALTANNEPRIYRTLNEPVYLYDTKLTIKALVDTINRYTTKIYIDTVNVWPKQTVKLLPGQRIDSGYLYRNYGPPKQFILKTCKMQEAEKERKEKEKLAHQQAIDNWQPTTLTGQLQKYYASSFVTSLGWLNCDRFYQNNQQPMYVDLNLPATIDKGNIQYFIIFKNFNGLIDGKLNFESGKTTPFRTLPPGEPLTIIAFTKYNGQIFHCRQDCITEKDKIVKLDFKNISAEEITKMFGKNVRI